MSDSASRRVVQAVAEATNTDPVDLPPLYGVIDPDALDAIFRPTVDGHGSNRGRGMGDSRELRFFYAGREVSVRSDGVTVGPPTQTRRPTSEE
jgi:hypothetical protein